MVSGRLPRPHRSALHAAWQALLDAVPAAGGARAQLLLRLVARNTSSGERPLPAPAAALALKRLKDDAIATAWEGEAVTVLGTAVGEVFEPAAAGGAAASEGHGAPTLPGDLDLVLTALNALRLGLARGGAPWAAAASGDCQAAGWLRVAGSLREAALAAADASAESESESDLAAARAASGAFALQEAVGAAEEALARARAER